MGSWPLSVLVGRRLGLAVGAAVAELFEDSNTNEVKFNLNEYSEMIGKYSNAVQDNGDVKLNKNQFLVLAKRFKAKFARVPTFKFIQGAIDTEVGEVKKHAES